MLTYRGLKWRIWWCGWRLCMWMAVRNVSFSLTWYDWAYKCGRACEHAGGPMTYFVKKDKPD